MGDAVDRLGRQDDAPLNWPFFRIEIQLRLTVTE